MSNKHGSSTQPIAVNQIQTKDALMADKSEINGLVVKELRNKKPTNKQQTRID